jgi:hypothetical protein
MDGAVGWVIIGLIAGVLLALAALWIYRQQATAAANRTMSAALSHKPAQANADDIERLRQNLRLKTLHNEALIDRLVQAERERMPAASEAECYRSAIERWERDNR